VRIILVLSMLVFSVRVAAASCGAAPHTAFSPRSGAQLPPHPTIYLFDTDHETDIQDALSVDSAAGDAMRFRATKISTTGDYAVHRIELYRLSTREGSIRVWWHGQQLATYTIVEEGEPDHAQVVDVTHDRHGICPFVDVFRIAVAGNATAFQLDWDDDRTTILADADLMWSGESAEERAVIELGRPTCMHWNVDPYLLGTTHSFELYALFADGLVKRLGSSVAQLGEHVREPKELLRSADVRFPRGFTIAVATSPWVYASAGTGGLAGAAVVLLSTRRRRKRDEAERLARATLA
jgi:hypothetical protein